MVRALKQFILNLSLTQISWMAIALCVPAFFINLGAVPFIGDEAIRTLVTLEMKMTGNFIVPTISGEAYFNKPPLYNWFIFLFSELFGFFGEWPTRVTTLLFLGCFTLTVYYFMQKQFDRLTAVTLAFMTLTSGRILLWDSMLGLIDICFSWIIFSNFMILYLASKAKRWRAMFLISYLLFSVAFLLKGFPAIVFQGISILVVLQFRRVLKRKLFSIDHFIGIGVGVLPVLAYYVLYAFQVDLDHVFGVLLDQSLQRTALKHSVLDTVMHFFSFPFEQIYHFLPWSILIAIAFHPKVRYFIRSNEFVSFNFWILLANIPVYWLSKEVYPRYLLMFIPLFNVIGYFVLCQIQKTNLKWWTAVRYLFIFVSMAVLLAAVSMPFIDIIHELPFLYLTWVLGVIFLAFGTLGLLWDIKRTFFWFVFNLLVFRSVFNLVVLPVRAAEHEMTACRSDCLRVGKKYADGSLYIYGNTNLNLVTKAYASIYANQVIPIVQEAVDSSAIYIVQKELNPEFDGIRVDSLVGFGGRKFTLMRLRENQSGQ